eukprot:m.40806 g.40806  ORF g.40806 m.40806 type:complete len:124 (-) comp6018_c1_seq1:791-1162(-)
MPCHATRYVLFLQVLPAPPCRGGMARRVHARRDTRGHADTANQWHDGQGWGGGGDWDSASQLCAYFWCIITRSEYATWHLGLARSSLVWVARMRFAFALKSSTSAPPNEGLLPCCRLLWRCAL